MNKKYFAECLGTFILSFTVFLSVGAGLAGSVPIAVPLVAGLALGLCVYTIGHISGAHLNPAVTLAPSRSRRYRRTTRSATSLPSSSARERRSSSLRSSSIMTSTWCAWLSAA